jgi:hypothetical protein
MKTTAKAWQIQSRIVVKHKPLLYDSPRTTIGDRVYCGNKSVEEFNEKQRLEHLKGVTYAKRNTLEVCGTLAESYANS